MKNQTTKFNKSKLVARVMLLILLLTSAFGLSGCEGYPDKKYILINNSHFGSSYMKLQATSDTKVFPKNNVTFDLSYSMHSINSKGESSIDIREIEKGEFFIGLYITDKEHMWLEGYDAPIESEDLAKIDNHILIKQLTEDEALSEEYLRFSPQLAISAYGGGIVFNHTESITIPMDFVKEEGGTFVISIIAFRWIEDSQLYCSYESNSIEFVYKETDENTIEIDMDDWIVYLIIP